MPGAGLRQVAFTGQLRNHALGMVEAESEIVEARAFGGQQLQDPSLDCLQLGERHQALGGARLIGDAHQRASRRR